MFVSRSGNITHEGAFDPSNTCDYLNKTSCGDGVRANKGGNTVGEVVEGVSGVVDVSRKVESTTNHNPPLPRHGRWKRAGDGRFVGNGPRRLLAF